MDIKKTLEEITKIEREKAQLELRQKQLEEQKDALAKKLAGLGVSPKDLDTEAKRLEASITERLEAIRVGPIKSQKVRDTSDEDLEMDLKGVTGG